MRCSVFLAIATLGFMLTGCLHGPVNSVSGVGDLDVEIWASTDCIQAGETLVIRASVTNRGSRTFKVKLKDQPVFDIFIGGLDPPIRWSEGKPLAPDLTQLELGPGQSKTIEMRWIAVQPPGHNIVGVSAHFAYGQQMPGGPVVASVAVSVGACPGPFGP